jgi:hypothetical protein
LDSEVVFQSKDHNLLYHQNVAFYDVMKYLRKKLYSDSSYTVDQSAILNILSKIEKADVYTMSRLITREPNSLLQSMNRMVSKGILVKEKMGRKTLYSISPEHRNVRELTLFDKYAKEIYDCFTDTEKNQFLVLCDKLSESVEERLYRRKRVFNNTRV